MVRSPGGLAAASGHESSAVESWAELGADIRHCHGSAFTLVWILNLSNTVGDCLEVFAGHGAVSRVVNRNSGNMHAETLASKHKAARNGQNPASFDRCDVALGR
jgi:hypothetical protein